MRFYLTYKDHGFYDPVVDDTEVIYIPVDPEELEIVNIQTNTHENQQKVDKIDFNQTEQPSILVHPVEEFLSDPDIEDLPLLINVDEIPPGGKFRLPVSETYDPEGKRAKLDKIKGKAVVKFNVKNIVDETNDERTRLQKKTQDAVSEYISESKINQNEEIKEDFIETYKEADLNVIRDKALEVVNESIQKSISVAKEINENVKTEIKTSEDLTKLITNELSKSFEEKLENVNIRKESIKNIELDLNISEEIKKFEKIETQTNESNIEERKLLTKQEIDESIQSGTVRRTSEIFNKETIETSKPYLLEINNNYDSIHTERDKSIPNRDSSAKQRAFSIGLQTIPHIRENINPLKIDYRLNLLTTFFLQLTNIMVTLSRFIAIEPRIYLGQDSYTQNQDHRGFEKKKEKTKLDKSNEQNFESFEQHEEGQGLSKYKYEHLSKDSEGEIIRKGKLSGAKIAQIEGRKTTELTDKMDIVISEFHKKTGFEEQSHDQFYRSHGGSRSKMKSKESTCYGESQKQQNTDQEETFEEFFETKTQSLDISEMKSEKHSFESKTTKTETQPCPFEMNNPDCKNLTYVAIVEAHVYTNKEAIFEEQMRREREIATKNIEQTEIESNQDIRKLSLSDTIIIPQSEEMSVNEIKDEVLNIERAVTGIEESTIKIAAKKISEVLEPLVELTSGRSYSEQQFHMSREHLQKPRQVVESMTKSVAETTEVVTGSNIDMLITPEVMVKTSHTAIEGAFKATAETLTILPEESKSDFLETTKIKEESAKVLIGENVSSEVIEVSLIEQREESFDKKKMKIEQPTLLLEESAFSVAEKTSISPVEPKSDIEIFTKVEQTANIKFNELKAVENTIINLEEPGSHIFETPETKEKHPLTSIEDPHLTIAQVFTIEPNEPKDEHFEVSKITECKSSIDIVENKAAETTITCSEEAKYEQLEVLKIEEKIPETKFEGPSLKVAEVISMLSEEPKDEFYVSEPLVELPCDRSYSEQQSHTSKTHLQKPRQVVECMTKSVAETNEVVTGSNIDMLITPEVVVKTSHTAIEGAFKATAETLTILPEESKSDFLETTKIKEESAKVLIGENVSSEVIEVSLIEQREESLEEKKIKIEQPTLLLEESAFSVAEKASISPVEPKSDIEIFTKVEQTANIKFNELKAVENTIINLEEPGSHIFETPETKEKHPLTSMEDPHLTIAQVFTIEPNEPKDEHFEVSKITECKSSIDIVEIKAAETTITYPEEPKYEQIKVLKIEEKIPEITFEGPSLKVAEVMSMLSEEPKDDFHVPELRNQQAGMSIIEFKAAEATIVEAEESKQPELNIEQPKEKRSKEIIEPSSLSVAIKITQNVKNDEVSPTTPLSPTTPVVEEYLFSLEAELEHPYVVEEAVSEEALLRIKTQKKNIQSADTSFTLAIESIVEAGSESIEEITEMENIHLSKEIHQSMYEDYGTEKSNMSASIGVNSLEAEQIISTEAHSLMQDAINISSLETNENISTEAVNINSSKISLKKAAMEQGESMSHESSHISQSSVHKSNKIKSSESQYSADQELKTSVKSMQFGSLEANTQAESSQYTEDSNKQLSISASKSTESTAMEGNIGLKVHHNLRTASGSCKETVSQSVASNSFGTIESGTQLSAQVIKSESNKYLTDEKLTLRTDSKNTINNSGESSPPQSMPPTPLTDEYIFRLQTEMPDESTFIPRDCSFSPESTHEDVVVNGLLTNYKTKIDERIIYNPPLPTPPTSPDKAKPVYTKPGLKGGSERQKLTKEEIHDSTLVSAIDRTLKQIEEYKVSVGLTTEEMSYHQEDVDKEFVPIQIVEEWLDNEAQAKANTSQVEEVDAIKITVVTEDNNAGETAVTVTTERNVDDDDDLEIQEISSNFDEISVEIGHDRVLNEQMISENKMDDFKPVTNYPDDNREAHEEDYEWVAVHPSSLKEIGADDGRVSTNQFESEDLNVNVQEMQTGDNSQALVIPHDQEIIGDEAIIPPVESLKNSEVIKLLNEERTAVEERKWTTFLQKKYSPTPKTEVVYYGDFDIKTQIIPDAYKVRIVKQPKPKIAPDWKDKELKKESSPIIEISEPQTTEETEIDDNKIIEQDNNIIEEENHTIEEENKLIDEEEDLNKEDTETEIIEEVKDKEIEELELEEMAQKNLAEELIQNVENMIDINAPTDQQLEQMRDQLAALAQLPSVIQRTVELVHKRINMISEKEKQKKQEEEEYRRQEEEHRRQEEEYRRQEEEQRQELERAKHSLELRVTKTEEELAILKQEAVKRGMILAEKQKKEKVELMKIDQVSRQVNQRSNPRVGKPMALFGPTQERPVILPGGRKWRTPEDVYDEEFITDTLVGQAEVIKGTAIGVNFMKFDKPPPALDHLKNSEVFKAIHNIEPPMKKVELLGPVLSDADYREKARSMSPCVEKVAEFSGTKQS